MEQGTGRHEAIGTHDRMVGASLWLFALATVVLASGAVLIIMWRPRALWLALAVGLLAVASRNGFRRIKTSSHEKAEASSAVANAGLALAGITVAPLLAFAILWAGLLLFLGLTWLLRALHLI